MATARHRRLRGAFCVPLITRPGERCARKVGQQVRPHRATAAETAALMFGLKVRLVMDIAEAERAGVKAVFIRGSSTGKLPAQVCISLLPHLV
ncbi:Uncharacterised protein [Serratia plymuthica]|nr:Uncharacterised protein [Serratia plymuthica]